MLFHGRIAKREAHSITRSMSADLWRGILDLDPTDKDPRSAAKTAAETLAARLNLGGRLRSVRQVLQRRRIARFRLS